MSDLRNYKDSTASTTHPSAASNPVRVDGIKHLLDKTARRTGVLPTANNPSDDPVAGLQPSKLTAAASNGADALVPLQERIPKDLRHLYMPLDFDSFKIRLLELHEENSYGNGVTCSLVYASLIKPPEYTALSYCWGEASKTTKIRIKNWGNVEVTTNLEEALKSVRPLNFIGPGGSSRPKLLWVDALCS
jgi:hypothetical protein